MNLRNRLFIWVIFWMGMAGKGLSQQPFSPLSATDSINDAFLMETKWRYTYALHVESNTIIHQAENFYDFYLFLRYDYTYDQYLNGQLSKGNWSINGRTLFYNFKHIKKFEIAELTKKKLVLEFTQPNAKGTYQYHFVRVETKDAPFARAWNELPEVRVEAKTLSQKNDNRWWTLNRRNRKEEAVTSNEKQTYINIEVIGGGYYGGVDPVLRDFIHIKSDGRLIKEFKSVHNGLIVTKADIPRPELEQFAEWVIKQGYFDFERMYDCETSICQQRKSLKPTPIPLRLAITYGTRRKVVTVSIWGMDDNNVHYVSYPPALDEIIFAIQKMANRLEDSVVKK